MCAVNGDMLLTDLGRGEYTREYFGPNRYALLCNGSQGHSVPIVEGRCQSPGAEHFARVAEASGSDSTLEWNYLFPGMAVSFTVAVLPE